jgi:predicted AlkP superfamily phosphohydrolase/phosphomutase
MYTGVNPAKHSVFNFTYRSNATSSPHTASLLDVRAPAVWQFIGNAGYRVGVMNVPITFPAQPVNGFMLSGFPAPAEMAEVVWPRQEYAELVRQLPGFSVNWPGLGERLNSRAEKIGILEKANSLLQGRIEAFEYFLDRYEVDFCFLVFEYPDKVQHWFYPLLSGQNLRAAQPVEPKITALLKDGYRQIDRAIDRLIKRFGQETNYIITSDHGFGPVRRMVYLNHLLQRHGLFKGRCAKAFAAKIARLARVPLALRSRLGLAQEQPWHRLDTWRSPLTDFAHTRAFSGHQFEHAVYINLEGRCPEGRVRPGREYEQVRAAVIQLLREVKDPASGARIFEDAFAAEQIYSGKYLPSAPDIVFELAGGYMISAGIGLSGVLDGGYVRDARQPDGSGYHRPEGIFIGHGPGLRKTREVRAELVDIAPTVLALMGIAVPAEMDGRVIEEAIRPGILASGQLTVEASVAGQDDAGRPIYSADEEKQIAKRLAELGYL